MIDWLLGDTMKHDIGGAIQQEITFVLPKNLSKLVDQLVVFFSYLNALPEEE